MQSHAFAPVLILALVSIFAALVLPEKYRQTLILTIRNFETHKGLTSLLLSALMLYWCIRLMGIVPFQNIF
jgi:hypothetical protein